MDSELIRSMEEVSMNALPSLQTVYYDGWVLRFANGYTRRSNSVNPLYSTQSGIEIGEKIELCEKLYRSKGLRVVFKLTDAATPSDLNTILDARGYAHGDYSPVSIQLAGLDKLDRLSSHVVERSEESSDDWHESFIQLNKFPKEHSATLKRMLDAVVPGKCHFAIRRDGEIICCGLAVFQGEYVGLFDIVTDTGCRRQGLGVAITVDMMKWGKEHGARKAYLQVVAANEPAVRLYEKLGFAELYKYWYRVKE